MNPAQQAYIGRVVAPLLAVLGQVIDAEAPGMIALEHSNRPRFERWHGLVNLYRDTIRLLRMPPANAPRMAALALLDQAREPMVLWSVGQTDAWLANMRAAVLAIPGSDGLPVPFSPIHRSLDDDPAPDSGNAPLRALTSQHGARLAFEPEDGENLAGCIAMCESLKARLVPFGAREDGWDSLLATLGRVQEAVVGARGC